MGHRWPCPGRARRSMGVVVLRGGLQLCGLAFEGGEPDTQDLGCLGAIAVHALENLEDVPPLEVLELARGGLVSGPRASADLGRQVLEAERRTARHDERTLEDVPQLAHVPG